MSYICSLKFFLLAQKVYHDIVEFGDEFFKGGENVTHKKKNNLERARPASPPLPWPRSPPQPSPSPAREADPKRCLSCLLSPASFFPSPQHLSHHRSPPSQRESRKEAEDGLRRKRGSWRCARSVFSPTSPCGFSWRNLGCCCRKACMPCLHGR